MMRSPATDGFGYIYATVVVIRPSALHGRADHTFFAAISFNIALSSMASAKSFFSLAFSSSSDFSRVGEGGVVSGVLNLESSGLVALDWRPRHE
jgi:hypothetical protein